VVFSRNWAVKLAPFNRCDHRLMNEISDRRKWSDALRRRAAV
jgi:hypothetical protein